MKIRWNEQDIIEGENATELMRGMRASSFTPGNDEADFMRKMADRILVQFDVSIRSDSADNFIADLFAIKAIEEVV